MTRRAWEGRDSYQLLMTFSENRDMAVNPTTVALILLLLVLGTATMTRPRIAIVVAIVATLALNYFFLPPVGTFTIADPQNWIALVAFLIVAVVASQLSTAAKDRALARQKAELASTL